MSRAAQAVQFMQKAAVSDPSFSSVNLLCHFDGTNGSTTYTDSSATAVNPTNIGGSTDSLTTTGPLFGTACLNALAVRGITRTVPVFGTGDWTVEFAWKAAVAATTYGLFHIGGFSAGALAIYQQASQYKFYDGSDRIVAGTTSTSWVRICACKVSGNTRLFIGGTQVGSTYVDSTNYANTTLSFAEFQGGSNPAVGQFDELRVTVGVGRYTANYTPATAAFPNS